MENQRSLIFFLALADHWKISDWIHYYHNPHNKRPLLYDFKNCSIKFPNLMRGDCPTKRKIVTELEMV